MNTSKKFTVILSAYHGDSEINNLFSADTMRRMLAVDRIEYKNAVGVYKGQCEQSFIIDTNSSNTVNKLKRLAWEFNQECILVSNNQAKRIQLHYPNSTPLMIGDRFAKNNKLAGNKLLSYTIVNGQYWEVV